jgi:SAM-dependent methyltransferase
VSASYRDIDWYDLADHKIAAAYNEAGERYGAYADGCSGGLFTFDGQYAYGDRAVWNAIDGRLRALAATGARRVRILDLGCGPGTWLRRTIARARELGFERIHGRGLDIADEQIARARTDGAALAGLHGVELAFEVSDICQPLSEADGSVDLCLCLCGVLNHVPAAMRAPLFSEIRRVTKGVFIASVRAIGSTPTIYVDALEAAHAFMQDNRLDKLHVALGNGRHMSFDSHLFSSAELAGMAADWFRVDDLRGLDLFHGRFAEDRRWNPPSAEPSSGLLRELNRLEETYCRDAKFIDHATHLLLVAEPR